MRDPGEPSGNNRLAQWLRNLVRFARAHQIQSIYGARIKRTPNGYQIFVEPQNPTDSTSKNYPFRLYVHAETTGANAWRTFTVRGGKIGNTTVGGTDGASYPYSTDAGSKNEIEVPNSTAAYYFWIEYYTPAADSGLSPTATIKHSASPDSAVPGDLYSGNWPGFPETCTYNDIICVLIATVDTDTYSATSRALIRQRIRFDLPDIRQVCIFEDGEEKAMDVWCQGAGVTLTGPSPFMVAAEDFEQTVVTGADSEQTIVITPGEIP